MEGGRPEWTEKLRVREEEHRDSEGKKTGKRWRHRERKARETKEREREKKPR